MRQSSRILKRIAWGLSAAGAAGLLGYAALIRLPQLSGTEVFTVASGSMEPAIPAGSLIFVNTGARTPLVGAVLTCRLSGENTVTHRVYEVRENGDFILKGDRNETPDLTVTKPDAVIGTVTGHIPCLGCLLGRGTGPLFLTMCGSGFLAAMISEKTADTVKGENHG